jgi:PKD-like domain/SprB repeat
MQMKNNTLKGFFCLYALILLSFNSKAGNVNWLAAVPGNWNDGTKWSGGIAPGLNDTAIIDIPGTYTVTLNTNASISKLILGGISGKQTISSTGTILTIGTASMINDNGIYTMSSATINGAGALQNDGKIRLSINNTISVSLTLNDTIHIAHSGNTLSGNITTSTSSVIYMDCAESNSIVTIANGFINNGLIHLRSVGCSFAYLTITSGILTNAPGATFISAPLPNCVGFNRLDGRFDNQGTMNINYTLRHYSTAAGSTNSGTLNVASGVNYLISAGVWNYNGGAVSLTGTIYFENSIGNFNTATMPDIDTYFASSTLGSSIPSITSSRKIRLSNNNVISANLTLDDTLHIRHSGNSISGTLTTTTSSVIFMDCAESNSIVTIANGFINNGLIHLKSIGCSFAHLIITSGILTNAPGATFISDPLPNCVGFNRLDARFNNQGTMTINYTLRHYSTAAGSTNTGTLNVASGVNYLISAGVWNYNGGAVSLTGTLYFENSTGNFNTATMPDIDTYFASSTLGSSIPTITSSRKIRLSNNNVISANLTLDDTLHLRHSGNSISGTLTTTTSSVIFMDCAESNSIVTIANGFINNGLIQLKSVGCSYSYLTIAAGILTNAPGATFISDPNPNCVLYNRLDGILNNLGTIIVNYTLRHYSNSIGSTNTGTVHIATGHSYVLSAGIFNWNGGVATGNGLLSFENSTGNFNVPVMPNIETSFNGSTLGSTSLPVTSNRVINLSNNNTITAAIFNTDTIKVRHSGNTMTGALTTAPTSVIHFDASQSNSTLNITSGFTNNGLIRMSSSTCNYNYLNVSTGVMINAASGTIKSDPLPNCVGYNRLDAALDNHGTILVNYTLRHYTNAGASHTDGAVTIAAGYNLEIYNGIWNYDGGSVSGSGLLSFHSATGRFNTPVMPPVRTYFTSSTLASSLPSISTSKKIRLSVSNTISANLTNTDTILVQNNPNTVTGQFSNTASSLIWFDAGENHGTITFSNGFSNFGTILYQTPSCYYGYLTVSSGVLTNETSGIITSNPLPNCVGYNRLDAALNNLGTINVNYTFRHYTNAGASHNTGTINIASGFNLEIYNGIWNYDGGSVSGSGLLSFHSATGRFNTPVMPPVRTYFTSSTLASSLPSISTSKKIRLSVSNTISANLTNTDTILVQNNPNTVTGQFSNTASSLIWFDAGENHGTIAFSNGFSNFGKILYQTPSCYYGYLTVSSGVLTNEASGIITSNPLPNCVGYNRLDAALNNLGTINVNYTFRHYTHAGASHNTGAINIASGSIYEIYNGNWHWDGGTTSGNGLLQFNGAVASFNTPAMPYLYTSFITSTLTSSLPGITNSRKIILSSSNTIPANLNNTDTILVQSLSNNFTGAYTNTSNSLLWFDGVQGHCGIIFSNGFSNNGKILFQTPSCYYGYLYISAGTLINEATGSMIINPLPNCVGYHRIDGNIVNNGNFAINYQLFHPNGSFINNSGGILTGVDMLTMNPSMTINNGTISPGTSPGRLSFNNNLKNGNTSVWNIQIGGLTAITQHDQIEVKSPYTDSINGTLNISLINSFLPSLGDSVIIEKHGSLVGTFASITGQSIPGGLFWNVFYRPTHIVLRAGNPPNLIINSSAGLNGTINPIGNVSVFYNATQLFNIIPNPGYHIDDVLVDGFSVGPVSSYTFTNVITNRTISATFAINTYPISSSAGPGGVISPTGITNVNEFSSQMYTITPNPCFLIDSVIVDGIYIGRPTSYTFSNVTTPHSIVVKFTEAPRITAIGSLTFCDGDSVILDAGAGYSLYQWSNSSSTQTTKIFTSGTYTCTVTSTGGCTSSTSVTVTVHPLPVVTLAEFYPLDANHVCLNNVGFNLTASTFGQPTGGTYSGAGVINGFHQVFSPGTAGVGPHLLTYSFTDLFGCTNSASRTVTIDQTVSVNAGTDIVLCNNPTANLDASYGGSASSVVWSGNGSGSFSNLNDTAAIYTLSGADIVSGTVLLTLTTNDPSNTCSADSDKVLITYNPDAIAYAGPNYPVCSSTPVLVSGNILGYPATPLWTAMGTGSFLNSNALSTTYNPSPADIAAGKVFLILTPIDPLGNCTFTADTLEVWFDPGYIMNAGQDQVLCDDSIASLNGTSSNAISVQWSTSGSGYFTSPATGISDYILSAADRLNGGVFLTFTSDDPAGPCTAVYDQLYIKYKKAIADAGPPSICGDTSTQLNGSIASTLSYATPLWTTLGSGTIQNATSYSPIYHASNADLLNGSVKVILTAVDPLSECAFPSDTIEIYFDPHYYINAGPDSLTFCANDSLALSGTRLNATSSIWSSSGTGNFTSTSDLNTLYIPSASDTSQGQITIYLSSNDPAGPCNAVVDSITVIINPAPSASAGSNSPICSGDALNLTATGGIAYSWTGPLFFSSTLQNIVVPNSNTSMAGTYHVTVFNTFGCSNDAETEVIINPCGCTPPTLSETHTDVSCFGGSNGTINLNALGGSGGNTFLWSNNATTEDLTGLTAGIYTVTVTATGGCSSNYTVTIGEGIALSPIQINVVGGTVLCTGGSTILNAGSGWNIYNWSNGLHTSSIAVNTAGNYFVTVYNSSGCSAYSDTITIITTTLPPASTKNVSGPEAVCLGSTYPFSIRSVARAASYNWQAPTGVLINGNPAPFNTTDTAVMITFTTAPLLPYSGWNICVSSTNPCGTSNSKCLFVRYGTTVPVAITGPAIVCAGTTYNYKTRNVAGAYLYRWTLPAGALINGQAGTYTSADTSVNVQYLNSFTSGSICVMSSALGCVYSNSRCLAISITLPAPTNLTGQKTGVCNGTYIYSCNSVASAVSYKWTAPAGVLINGLSSPVNTTVPSASITYPANFNIGNICVQGISSCGSPGATTCLQSITGKPAKPVVLTGPTSVCPNQTNVIYSTSAVAGANTYSWTAPYNTSFTGNGTTAINVSFNTAGGNITVKAGNACGLSAATTLFVNVGCRESDLSESTINIYPNPASDKLFISMPDNNSLSTWKYNL